MNGKHGSGVRGNIPSFIGHGRQLLGVETSDENDNHAASHTVATAPVLTGDALLALGEAVFPQCVLYGRVISQNAPGFAEKVQTPELLINGNASFTGVVFGVQGSGKSHSTSVLLEGCLIRDDRIGSLPEPLSGLVFHFDTAAGGGLVQPCEAAYLASLDSTWGGDATPPQVTVLVLPTNLSVMKKVYSGLPSVKVDALRFSPEDISGERLLSMMKVDDSNQMPLYMETIMTTLRSMDEFNYDKFREDLKTTKFNSTQKSMLNLRLHLLDSCLKDGNAANSVTQHFCEGQLTIIDLSSPFMDSSSACGFFDVILSLFIEADIDTGKLVVLDEAHKYLTDTGSSSRLTESLLSIVRQHRHLNTRVLISTQEPTIVPTKILDLCSFIIAHRFISPKWLHHLAEHVSVANVNFDQLLAKIVALQTGQAFMFSPTGLALRTAPASTPTLAIHKATSIVGPLGQGYLLVQSRLRITQDGGRSILAVPDALDALHISRGLETVGAVGQDGPDKPQEVDRFGLPLSFFRARSSDERDEVSSGSFHNDSSSTTSTSSEEEVQPDFGPLIRLLQSRGGSRVNQIEVDGLKRDNPGLIPRGKGQVGAYIRAAVDAGLVTVEDLHWLVLVR